jgi:hypothetical protein
MLLPDRYSTLVSIYGDPSLEGGHKGIAPPGSGTSDTAGTSLASRLAGILSHHYTITPLHYISNDIYFILYGTVLIQ